jgi:hypothetical protein
MKIELAIEQENTIRSTFAEVFFLLMRRRRYGISNCKQCANKELLEAQLQTIEWKRQKDLQTMS